MAGSHKSGVTAAKERLFENAFYMLTPSKCAGVKEIGQLKMWLRGTKAKFLEVSAEEHDYLTGVISHLPHIMAASMVNFAEDAEKEHEVIARLAAGGFRDTTRIASSSPEMWKDILLSGLGMQCQCMRRGLFLLLMIFMWMCRTIQVSFQKLPDI